MTPRCTECRELAKELDTPLQRLKYRIISKFFAYEQKEIEQQFYTKGFSDGYKDGVTWGTEQAQKKAELFSQPQSIEPKYAAINPNDLIKFNGDNIKIGSYEITEGQKEALAQEADMVKKTRIFELLTVYLEDQAHQVMFNKSKDFQDLLNGKMMLYNIDVTRKFIDIIISLGKKN